MLTLATRDFPVPSSVEVASNGAPPDEPISEGAQEAGRPLERRKSEEMDRSIHKILGIEIMRESTHKV